MGSGPAVVLAYAAIALSWARVPVAALLLAFVFLAERPQPLQLLSGAIILAGVRIATLGPASEAVVEAAA